MQTMLLPKFKDERRSSQRVNDIPTGLLLPPPTRWCGTATGFCFSCLKQQDGEFLCEDYLGCICFSFPEKDKARAITHGWKVLLLKTSQSSHEARVRSRPRLGEDHQARNGWKNHKGCNSLESVIQPKSASPFWPREQFHIPSLGPSINPKQPGGSSWNPARLHGCSSAALPETGFRGQAHLNGNKCWHWTTWPSACFGRRATLLESTKMSSRSLQTNKPSPRTHTGPVDRAAQCSGAQVLETKRRRFEAIGFWHEISTE